MEYTIRCMEYFEKTALAVYEQICGGVSPFSGKLSQDQAIREFNRIVPITNRTWFAKGINKNLSQVSRALNTKDKP